MTAASEYDPPEAAGTEEIMQPGISEESTVAAFCGRLIEACWLVAAGVLPLVMDPLATDRFLPIKMALLNSLGLLAAGALLVRLFERLGRGRPGVPFWATAAAMLLAAHGISTMGSVNWRDSLWGGDAFLHGSLALLCQLSLFAGVATCLRSPEQIQRLVAVVLAASLPLALYAIYQRCGWDPLGHEIGDVGPPSFAGQPIFAAGSLLFAIPLCAWKLSCARREARQRHTADSRAAVVCFGVLLAIQIAALLATGKRGPFLGLLAAGTCAAVLHAMCMGRFRRAVAAIFLTASMILGLAGLALLAREFPSVRQIPVVERLAMIVPVGTGTGDEFRRAVWEKSPAMTLAGSPMIFPDGQTDRWWCMRPLVGYGPETLPAMFPQQVFIGGAAPGAGIESRLHNSFWDTLQSVGLLGLAATLLLQAAVFSRGLAGLGLSGVRFRPWQLAAAGVLLGLLSGSAMELFLGTGYFGLGFSMGFAAGLILWPLTAQSRSGQAATASGYGADTSLMIALLAALTAHWIDMCFAFPTANTSALAWICAGGIVALGGNKALSGAELEASADAREVPWLPIALSRGVLAGGMLAVLCHAFIADLSTQSGSAGGGLSHWLTRDLAIRLLVPAWFGALLLLANGREMPMQRGGRLRTFAVSGVVSFGVAAAWAVWKIGKLAEVGGMPTASSPLAEVIRKAILLENLAAGYLLFLLGISALVAVLLFFAGGPINWQRPGVPVMAAAVLALTTCVQAIRVTQLPVLSNHASGAFAVRMSALQPQAAAEIYQRVLQHNPRDLFSRIDGSKAAMAVAERSQDSATCLQAMRGAEKILQDGLKLNNRNVLHYFLGNVLMRQAFEMPAGAEREATAQRARAAFAAALRYAPNTEVAWFEASLVERDLLGEKVAADAFLARADGIATTVDPVIFGEQYSYQMQTTASPTLNPTYGKRGVEYFTRALERPGILLAKENARLRVVKGTLLINLRRPAEARDCLLEATRLGETPDLWRAQAMLAELFLKAGDLAAAGPHLDEAIRRAPDETKRNLERLKVRFFR
jgi:tetratricopeptide (TPR) repeat protein